MWLYFLLFMALTFIVIYYSCLLTNEVRQRTKLTSNKKLRTFLHEISTHLQSKRTARIAHDIINRCHCSDVIKSVRSFDRKTSYSAIISEIVVDSILMCISNFSISWVNYRSRLSFGIQLQVVDSSQLIGIYFPMYERNRVHV